MRRAHTRSRKPFPECRACRIRRAPECRPRGPTAPPPFPANRYLRLPPIRSPCAACAQPAVNQRFAQTFVSVLELHVLADDRDAHLALRIAKRSRSSSHALMSRSWACKCSRRRISRPALLRPVPPERHKSCPCPRMEITRDSGMLQNSAIFLFKSCGRKRSLRHSSKSGWIPIESNSLTECCVGLVFNSPAVGMNGTSVTCTNTEFSGPSSSRIWRTASRNGSDSMSPTVPPISTMTTSVSPATLRNAALISSVTCGITCTVLPR